MTTSSGIKPSASYSLTIRTETANQPGMLGRITTAIGEEGGDIGAIDIAGAAAGKMVRDITLAARDEVHGQAIVRRLESLPGVHVANVSDRTFLLHLGGKIEVVGRSQVKTRDDLGDLAADDLVEMTGVDAERAKTLIMGARAHWFTQE